MRLVYWRIMALSLLRDKATLAMNFVLPGLVFIRIGLRYSRYKIHRKLYRLSGGLERVPSFPFWMRFTGFVTGPVTINFL